MIDCTIATFAPVGKNSLFAVKVVDGDQEHTRVVPTSSRGSYTAQLLALKYACAVADDKNAEISIKTTMPYLATAFQKKDGKWKASKTSADSKLMTEIQEMLDQFESFEIVVDKDACEPLKIMAKETSI